MLFNPFNPFNFFEKKEENSKKEGDYPLYTKINLFKFVESKDIRKRVRNDIENLCKMRGVSISDEWLFSKEDFQYYLDFNEFIANNKVIHCGVIGRPGFGKSNILKVFLNELSKVCYEIDNTKKKISAVVIDPASELIYAKTYNTKKIIVDIRYEERATCNEEKNLQKKRENKLNTNIVITISPNYNMMEKKKKKKSMEYVFKVSQINDIDGVLENSLRHEGFFEDKELTEENINAVIFKLVYNTMLNQHFLFFTFFLNVELQDFIASKIVQTTLVVGKTIYEAEKKPTQHTFFIIDELPSFAPVEKMPQFSQTMKSIATFVRTGRKYLYHTILTSQSYSLIPLNLRRMLNIKIFCGSQEKDDIETLEKTYPIIDTAYFPSRGRETFLSLIGKYSIKRGFSWIFGVYDDSLRDLGVFAVKKSLDDEI